MCQHCYKLSRLVLPSKISPPDMADKRALVAKHLAHLSDTSIKLFSITTYYECRALGLSIQKSQAKAARIGQCTTRTVHNWLVEFESSGNLPESKQGKYAKTQWLLVDEDIQQEVREWIREHAAQPGKPRMRVVDFQLHINSNVLPKICLDQPGRTITEETARHWLLRLGFKRLSIKTGAYKDGHERPDNAQDRLAFEHAILQLDDHRDPLPSINILPERMQALRMQAINSNPVSINKPIIYCYADESIFHANDDERHVWTLADNPEFPLLKKSEGAGIMVLDFMLSIGEFVELTEEEFGRAKAAHPQGAPQGPGRLQE